MGHDNHNIITLGINHADMGAAVNETAKIQGGQVFAVDGKIISCFPFPVCGLLTDLSADELAEKKLTTALK